MGNNSPDLLPSVHSPGSPDMSASSAVPEEHGANYGNPSNEHAASQALERGVSAPAPDNSQAPSNQSQPVSTSPYTQDPLAVTPLQPPHDNSHPAVADDNDLIEKEWVDKAKEIVARTTQDPYKQNQEITNMKVGYLKKRYNKDIKISKDN